MKSALIKILAGLMSNGETRKKVFSAVLGICGFFLFLMFAPLVVLSSMGDIQSPDLDSFDTRQIISAIEGLQTEAMQIKGEEIASAMEDQGIRQQTIKAQLIYFSFFDEDSDADISEYVQLFADAEYDADLIDSINSKYGLSIDYDEYMQTYVFVMNSTLNEYMFTDADTKNAADLAAWAENAYVSGWAYTDGGIGAQDAGTKIRGCDDTGLILGYLNYNADEKVFGAEYSDLTYTEQGDVDTLPEVAGLGLYDGTTYGVYVGGGKVIWSDGSLGYVTKDLVANGRWTSWGEFGGIDYPKYDTDESSRP